VAHTRAWQHHPRVLDVRVEEILPLDAVVRGGHIGDAVVRAAAAHGVDGDRFQASREDELRQIHATIRNRGRLFLIGPRRYGKTSLLAAAAREVDPDDIAIVRINAEAFEGPALFAAELTASATKALRTPVEQGAEWIRSVLGRLRPRVAIGPTGLEVEFGLADGAEGVKTVVQALNALDTLAADHAPRGLVIIIDEVQEILTVDGIAAEKQIRAAVQEHRNTGYIFAGSATRLLHEMTSLADRPFYRLGARLFLGPIPRDEFGAYLAATFANSGIDISRAAVEHILGSARDVPYNVMRLAHEVWELARIQVLDQPVEAPGVDAALERIIEQKAAAHVAMWRSFTRVQKKTMKAVIEEDGRRLQSRAVSERYRVDSSSVQRALEALEERQVIRQDLEATEPQYALVDPFFAAWLARAQRAEADPDA